MNFSNAVSRRQFVQLGLAGLASAAMAAKLHSVVGGLHIGIQTYSLRGLRYPDLVSAIQEVGIAECELFSVQVEPTAADAPDIMKWRDSVSLDYFKDIRKKFNQAGIAIYTYNPDRKSTRLNSSHMSISYAVFCLKKKKNKKTHTIKHN